jgi:hypothetical protein
MAGVRRWYVQVGPLLRPMRVPLVVVASAVLSQATITAAQVPPAVESRRVAQDSIRVFFLGRSEFGASGGISAPFQEVCALAGTACRANRHWDFLEPECVASMDCRNRNGIPIPISAVGRNRHVLRILATQKFDAVFFSFFHYNTEFFRPEPGFADEVLDGFEGLYRLITVAGARMYVNTGYATQDHPGDTARIRIGSGLLMARLDSVAASARTASPMLVPGGEFYQHMVRELGESWLADSQHASRLGQYGMARFFFSCMTGRDPTTFGHPEHIPPAAARRIDAAIVRHSRPCAAN